MSFPGSVLLSAGDILNQSATKVLPLGTRGYTRDGRVFRYARNGGTALKAGYLVQSSVPLTGDLALKQGATKLSANTTKIKIITAANAVMSTINAYADGYFYCYSTTTAEGAGLYAQIKSHSTESATATGLVTINFADSGRLYSGIGTTYLASTIGAKVAVMRNPYDKVVVKPAGAATALAVGVPVRPITASYYFWLQTWGACPLRVGKVHTIGYNIGLGTDATAGIAQGATVGTTFTKTTWGRGINAVGSAMTTGVAGEARLVYLKLAP
jgi:hypothetical protein